MKGLQNMLYSIAFVTLLFAFYYVIALPLAWGVRELFELEYELTLLNVLGFSIIFMLTLSSAGFSLYETFSEESEAGPRVAAVLKSLVYTSLGVAAFLFFFVPAYGGIVLPYLATGVGVLVVLGLINGTLFC